MWLTDRRFFILLILIALILSASCASNDLTRAKALDLLSNALQPATRVGVTNDAYRLAQDEGFLPQASQYFTDYWYMSPRLAVLKVPLKRRVVEVTGITDAAMPGGDKAAQFTWTYVDVPDPVNRYTGTLAGNHTGTAIFKLYDDGWRVGDIQLQEVFPQLQ